MEIVVPGIQEKGVFQNISETSSYTEEIASLTTGLFQIVDSNIQLEELDEWIADNDVEREIAHLNTLRSAYTNITENKNPNDPYSNFIGLVKAAGDVCLTFDTVTEESHEYMRNNLQILDQILKSRNGEGADRIVALLSCHGTPETERFLLAHFAEAIVTSPKRDEFEWIFEDLIREKTNEFIPAIVGGFAQVLEKRQNMDPDVKDKVLEWTNIPTEQPKDRHYWSIEHLISAKEHVRRLIELEEEAPGSTKYLMEYYNIHCFSWYPKELLINQYKNRDLKTNKPYGLLFMTLHDWNESIRRTNKDSAYTNFYKSVKEKGFELRATEVATIDDFISQISQSKETYGEMDFAIIDGHANTHVIQFGEENNDHILTRDLNGPIGDLIKNSVKKNGTIVLGGCLIGQINGFAQKLSESNFTVIASNSISNLKKLGFFPNESLPIEAIYAENHHTNVYKNRILIKSQNELLDN